MRNIIGAHVSWSLLNVRGYLLPLDFKLLLLLVRFVGRLVRVVMSRVRISELIDYMAEGLRQIALEASRLDVSVHG